MSSNHENYSENVRGNELPKGLAEFFQQHSADLLKKVVVPSLPQLKH